MRKGCAPYALSKLLDVSFEKMNNWLKENGCRKDDNSGTRLTQNDLRKLGFIPVLFSLSDRTPRQFVNTMHKSKWLIFTEGHVMALENNTFYNTHTDHEEVSIKSAWELVSPHKL